jgi:hypothetical protein
VLQFGFAIIASFAIRITFALAGSDPGIQISFGIATVYGLLLNWRDIGITGIGISTLATLVGYGILRLSGVTAATEFVPTILWSYLFGLSIKLVRHWGFKRPARE